MSTVITPTIATRGDLGALIEFSADAAQTVTSNNQENILAPVARGVVIMIDITAISGTSPTLTVTLQGFDKYSGLVYTLLASAALTTTGQTTLIIFPGATASSNAVANMTLPPTWNVKAVIGGTSVSLTGSISAAQLY